MKPITGTTDFIPHPSEPCILGLGFAIIVSEEELLPGIVIGQGTIIPSIICLN